MILRKSLAVVVLAVVGMGQGVAPATRPAKTESLYAMMVRMPSNLSYKKAETKEAADARTAWYVNECKTRQVTGRLKVDSVTVASRNIKTNRIIGMVLGTNKNDELQVDLVLEEKPEGIAKGDEITFAGTVTSLQHVNDRRWSFDIKGTVTSKPK